MAVNIDRMRSLGCGGSIVETVHRLENLERQIAEGEESGRVSGIGPISRCEGICYGENRLQRLLVGGTIDLGS
jgi:hypothetical protein